MVDASVCSEGSLRVAGNESQKEQKTCFQFSRSDKFMGCALMFPKVIWCEINSNLASKRKECSPC